MKKTVLFFCLIVALMCIHTHAQAQAHEQAISFRLFYLLSLQPDEETNILSSAFLDDINDVHGVKNDSWPDKLGFGALNTITSWIDIPREVISVSGKQNLVAGFTLGLGKGIVSSLARGASGVLDMATFGIPPYDRPAMLPGYEVKNPQQGLKVALLSF